MFMKQKSKVENKINVTSTKVDVTFCLLRNIIVVNIEKGVL